MSSLDPTGPWADPRPGQCQPGLASSGFQARSPVALVFSPEVLPMSHPLTHLAMRFGVAWMTHRVQGLWPRERSELTATVASDCSAGTGLTRGALKICPPIATRPSPVQPHGYATKKLLGTQPCRTGPVTHPSYTDQGRWSNFTPHHHPLLHVSLSIP